MTLKQLLFTKGKRQVEVAKAIGWCPSAFNKFLNGWVRIPEKYQSKLCKELSITKDELLLGKFKE